MNTSRRRWRRTRFPDWIELRRNGRALASVKLHCGTWYGHSRGSLLSAGDLREIARKVDSLNAREAKP